MNKYVLKIKCSDEKGLIHKIADVLYSNDLNIEKNNEFVDGENKKFFFRARIDGLIDSQKIVSELKAVMPKDAEITLVKKVKKKIIVLVTKESHCLGDILLKHDSGELNADIQAVVSNYDILRPLCQKFDIPYHCVLSEGMSREEHEKAVLEVLGGYDVDYLVLAKYMRILSENFVSQYDQRIINIHHSFLPAFIGANPYKQAHKRGVKIIGATAHFVNNNLDEGPIIAQDVIPVNHELNWKNMQRAGKNVEKTVLSNALDLVFDDKIFVHANKTIVF
ncbi:formyltetrahydrofolate deformylase [Sulfurospirillum sp. 1612]|uniref:formyltetrahydrofolate deformylase n=1 Tax=Sulfurospirillum sp. 1612 TaxID=3094835 RepID=UPI002F95F34E